MAVSCGLSGLDSLVKVKVAVPPDRLKSSEMARQPARTQRFAYPPMITRLCGTEEEGCSCGGRGRGAIGAAAPGTGVQGAEKWML